MLHRSNRLIKLNGLPTFARPVMACKIIIMQIRAIIFDFGNVLVKWDARQVFKQFFPDAQAVESFMQEIDFNSWNSHQDQGRPFNEGVALLSKQFPNHSKIIEAYHTQWHESLVAEIIPTVNIARYLKKLGYKMQILTNSSAEKFPIAIQKFPFLNEIFEDMVISGEHHLLKPDPAIYHLTLTRNGYNANQCLFIDDSPINIKSASLFGFHTIHYQTPEQLNQELNYLIQFT